MVTFAQAQERAEEWINGDVPAYQHREVRVREFELGFVVWAEDREQGPTSDGGRQRLVIARDSGEATLWPGLPVGEVIRRYEEEYGTSDEAGAGATPPAPPERIDLNATSFLLSPPEWLQDAADKIGLPKGPNASQAGGSSSAPETAGAVADASPSGATADASPDTGTGASSGSSAGRPVAYEPTASDGVPASSPWADANASSGGAEGSVPLPATVFAPPLSGADDEDTPPPIVGADAPTALMSGGSALPPTAIATPALDPNAPPPAGSGDPFPPRRPAPTGGPGAPAAPGTPAAPSGSSGSFSSGGPATGAPDGPASVGGPGSAGTAGSTGGPASSGGSGAPAAPGAPGVPPAPGVPAAPVGAGSGGSAPSAGGPGVPPAPGAPGTPGATPAPGARDIADAATSKAVLSPRAARGSGGNPPPPPQAPGAPGAPAGGYVPTQLVAQLGPDGPQPPGPPTPPQPVHQAATMLAHPSQGGPGSPPPPPAPPGMPGGSDGAGVAHAATMLAHPSQGGPGSPPPPPAPPGMPGGSDGAGVAHAATMLAHPGPGGIAPPGPPGPPGAPGAPGTPPGGVHHAATMLAQPGPGGPPAPPVPPPSAPGTPPGAPTPPPAYGYPQQPSGQPTVGPGYQAVLRYRAPDGSEAQIIRRSAPGTPHPEWQILHELRAMNVPPQQVLELHTELESCELPGGYCARMIRETWPQARITNIAPYGKDHAGRQQGMRQLLTHQGELHQVADGPARPAPVRAPLPPVQPAPPIPPEGVAQELAGAFGPGICRFDQRAVSRQGVPEIVALTLVWAGLPADFGPFFWAQPAHPVVPTLAELAAQRQVQPASDAGSYLVIGSDFGRAICVQYGTAHIVAVPVEAGPGGQPVPPQFVNSGLPEFTRSMALLGRMWRLRFGLNPEQAGRWTVDFQAQLAMLDPAALASPENWWSVLLEQMWDGLL
ncbi:SUKH-4 family immunity protein [Streptomyces sp. NPDC046712]|uniref:SUKH-4 family immunity protein n=1 Tax=Streptomyces sp. NPDC046712 TaxID=3154802 RepID=UPI003406EB51